MNVRTTWLLLLFTVVTVVTMSACSNPADGKPEAAVAEPTPAAEEAMPAGETYALAPESAIEFTGSKVTGSHEGGFNGVTGAFTLVNGDPTASRVEIEIDVRSMWTDSDRLTGHLLSPDFFDVETHPTATFASSGIVAEGDVYQVTGDLTLHGVTKQITFPATVVVGPSEITTRAEFVLKRFDFDIVYPGKPDDLIRDEVVVRFDLTATPEV